MLVLYKLNYLKCNLKNKAWHFLIGRIVNSVRANLIRIRDDVKKDIKMNRQTRGKTFFSERHIDQKENVIVFPLQINLRDMKSW